MMFINQFGQFLGEEGAELFLCSQVDQCGQVFDGLLDTFIGQIVIGIQVGQRKEKCFFWEMRDDVVKLVAER